MFLFTFERERVGERGGGAEREGGRGSEADSTLTAVNPMQGVIPGNHDLSQSQILNRLSHPGTPYMFLTFFILYLLLALLHKHVFSFVDMMSHKIHIDNFHPLAGQANLDFSSSQLISIY